MKSNQTDEKIFRQLAIKDVTAAASAVLAKTSQLVEALAALDRELISLAGVKARNDWDTTMNPQRQLQDVMDQAEKMAVYGKVFTDGARDLSNSPLDEIDRAITELASLLAKAQELHTAVIAEIASVQAKIAAALRRQRSN